MATLQNQKLSSISSSPAASASSPSPSFSLCRTDELEKVFNRFDADGDGRISASELADVLCALGCEASLREVQDMIAEMDADGDGSVDFSEFADFHRRRRNSSGAEAELRDAFGVYDIDSNGLISAEELHKVLSRLGEKCSVKDCSRMIKSVDADGDGCVNFEEFKKMMTVRSNGVGGSKSGRN